jgi:Domain of unknown function (DUF4157)
MLAAKIARLASSSSPAGASSLSMDSRKAPARARHRGRCDSCATVRQLESDADEPPEPPSAARYAFDFSSIRIHPAVDPSNTARLRVSKADDASERAAHDAVGTGPFVLRHPADMSVTLDVNSVVAPALRDPGEPLLRGDRTWAEHRFHHDFSRVRIHKDGLADASARRLDAAAYAVGSHIVFSTGQYRPRTLAGRALLAHELAHVADQTSDAVHRSGPLGFFGDIFTAGPSEALSRLFGEGDFSVKELTTYLGKLRDTQRIEGDYDSDNKARAITRMWVQGDRRFQLDPTLKKLLVREMWEGTTSTGDAQAILDILERSLDSDLLAIFTIGGVPPKDLYDSFGKTERQRLVTLLDQRIKGGSAVALKGGAFEFVGGPSAPSHLNDETFRTRWEKALVDAVDRMKKAMVADPAACRFPSESTQEFDVDHWKADPMVQQTTPQGTITIRDPSGKGSFVPVTGTPLEAVQSLFDNMAKWQCDCLFATQLAQLFAWKEVLSPEAFNTKFAGFRTGAGKGSATTGLENETVSVVGESNQPDLERALRNSPVGTVVVWNNTSKFAQGTAFEFEHVIKFAHKEPGQDDLYAAQGFEGAVFGSPLTADQIRWDLAEINPDFPSGFALTMQTISDLRNDHVAPSVISQLEPKVPFEAATWLEFSKLQAIRELMELTNPEAREQLGKIKKRAKRTPPDPKAARTYVDNTIVLDRIEIPK